MVPTWAGPGLFNIFGSFQHCKYDNILTIVSAYFKNLKNLLFVNIERGSHLGRSRGFFITSVLWCGVISASGFSGVIYRPMFKNECCIIDPDNVLNDLLINISQLAYFAFMFSWTDLDSFYLQF